MMLTVENLHKSYQVGKTTYEVLKGISLAVDQGEFVGVMGPSGSGKTTLLHCISCYLPADGGRITLGERALADLDEAALADRKAKWVCPEPKVKTGYLARYAKLVTSAARGAVLE